MFDTKKESIIALPLPAIKKQDFLKTKLPVKSNPTTYSLSDREKSAIE